MDELMQFLAITGLFFWAYMLIKGIHWLAHKQGKRSYCDYHGWNMPLHRGCSVCGTVVKAK